MSFFRKNEAGNEMRLGVLPWLSVTYCIPIEQCGIYRNPIGGFVGEKTDVWQGTLALMVLKTLDLMGPQHGYGIARRIEQTSGNRLALNYGTLYPMLLKLEQEGAITSEWGVSDNNRRAKFYRLTRAGRKRLESTTQDWQQTIAIVARFLSPAEEA